MAPAARRCAFWPLAVARELDDLILHLRTNELTLGTWVIRTAGDMDAVLDHDRFLLEHRETDWFVNEVTLLLKRVFKRLDVTSRSLLASIEPGSCFGGLLLELALACDQQFMLDGAMDEDEHPAVDCRDHSRNLGMYPMGNDLSRLESRFFGRAPRARCSPGDDRRSPRRRSGFGARAGDLRARRHRLGGRAAHRAGTARRRSARTRSRRWRRISDSPAPRPWRRRSSGGSPPGRIGCSAAPTRSARPARCAATAAVSARRWTRNGCDMSLNADYTDRIPNNVDLRGDRRLQRALEAWQPRFMQWWRDLGPDLIARDVYLRTAISADRDGWAHFGHIPLEEYRWGIFLADREPDRRIAFGEHMGIDGVAAGARRISSRPAAPAGRPGGYRARIGGAATPARLHGTEPLRPSQSLPGQCRGGPSPLGDGLPAPRVLRSRGTRAGRGTVDAPLRQRGCAAHPRRLQ